MYFSKLSGPEKEDKRALFHIFRESGKNIRK
jgi:hypothetical protein